MRTGLLLRTSLVVAALIVWGASIAQAQQLSGDLLPDAKELEHSPRGALWRAAAIPGWGQVYNKQYVKLPFVYGALGGLVYSAMANHSDYELYKEAFQYKAFQEQVESELITENPRLSFKPSYDKIEAEFGTISSRPLETQRNNFRRSRDFSFVGIGLVYSLAMLDAFVSAHLLDFDVGEDLNMQIIPQPGGFRLQALVPLERRAHRRLSKR